MLSMGVFEFTGAMQSFVVPAGVTSITVVAAGAQGGQAGQGNAARSWQPGLGGVIVSTLSVTPLMTLFVFVGGAGSSGVYTNQGGFSDGGSSSYCTGFDPYTWGGGGGGSSDVRTVQDSLASRLVVAGGGGGECVVNDFALMLILPRFSMDYRHVCSLGCQVRGPRVQADMEEIP